MFQPFTMSRRLTQIAEEEVLGRVVADDDVVEPVGVAEGRQPLGPDLPRGHLGVEVAEEDVGDADVEGRPHQVHDEAVRPRIVVEGEARERGIARIHPHGLDAHEKEEGPEQIRPIHGGYERPERQTRLGPLRADCDGEVSGEGDLPLDAALDDEVLLADQGATNEDLVADDAGGVRFSGKCHESLGCP